ncbi:MAG: serine hydrolase domain-containing protein [Pseudomonadota bacterium]
MDLQHHVDTLQAAHPACPGFAMAAIDSTGTISMAGSGFADRAATPFSAQTPVRTASVTKTIVAAAVLRLYETNQLDIDHPIRNVIDPSYNMLLQSGSFDTQAISTRHLAMHAAGMADHFVSNTFMTRVFGAPDYRWSRQEQLEILVEAFEPLSAPGERYAYSDSGYILLGHIIERVTDAPLPTAVRQLTKLNSIGLRDSWWDALEAPIKTGPLRAHQYRDGLDIHGFDGSMDAYGGGGLIASTTQMARFFRALFDGRIFDHPETLTTMLNAPGHPRGSPYRIGLFASKLGGLPAYSHAGYWGTNVIAVPALNLMIAGTTLEKAASKALIEGMEKIVELIALK